MEQNMTRRNGCLRVLTVGLLAVVPSGAEADIGLGARFGDVILEGAQTGRTYNLREAAHVPFGIENKGDAETEVVIDFSAPGQYGLAKDYEPIPDPSWFKSIPARMRIGPKSVGFFDLLLTIPDDPKLVGKHFQAVVKARMDGTELLAVAIENRVRISIGPGPDSLKAEKKKKAMQQLDFDVTPQSLFIGAVPLGKKFDVRKEQKKTIRVANYANDPLSIRLSVETWDTRTPLPEGYDAIPDAAWVQLKTATIVVAGAEIGQAFLTIEVPQEEKHKGRKWAAMIRAGLTEGFWLDAPVKLLIETAP
jgi:hypothetical protein